MPPPRRARAEREIAMEIDFESLGSRAAAQFRGLNPNEPGQWPILPKLAVWCAATVLVVVLGWFFLLSDTVAGLEGEQQREAQLKDSYRGRLAQAINLDELRKQKLQVQEYVTQLERQLPAKAEMDALLSDINQAGLGRGLQWELFQPGQSVAKDYYAELPISLKLTGRFHDIGAFTADIANLSRIVTLHSLVLSSGPTANAREAQIGTGTLTMEATARTYRYLDPAEVDAIKATKAAAAAKQGGKP
jgi:type IV pilus assembly protein PilO